MVERGYEGYVVKDRAGLDGGGRGVVGCSRAELHGSRKDRWQRPILGEDTLDRQSEVRRLDVLALICAERTRQAGRFQSRARRESCSVLEASNENPSGDRRLHGTTQKD